MGAYPRYEMQSMGTYPGMGARPGHYGITNTYKLMATTV